MSESNKSLFIPLTLRSKKKEDTYIGVVHRLDQPVCGLLVFAKTKSSAAALSHQRSQEADSLFPRK